MNTVIIIDSSCDLPLEFIEKNKIPFLGLVCHLDGKEYVDDFGKTLTYEKFYNRIREGCMPTTSQINVYRFYEAFKKYVEEGKSVIYLAMSSKMSGCYNSAVIAKQQLEEELGDVDISVVDTKSACIGEGLLVYYACEMLKNGATKNEIVDWVENNKINVQHWFIVEDLLHLKKGGRLSAAKANIGTLLQIKPTIYIDKEGNLVNISNSRGRKKAVKGLIDKIREKERETDRDKERTRDRVSRKTHEEDYELDNVDDKVDYQDKRDEEIGKQEKDSKLDNDNQDGQTSAHLSSTELEDRILK